MPKGGLRSTSFKAGNTAAAGRPKHNLVVVADVKALARGYSEVAIRALVSVLESSKTPPAARVSAATAILDRGWGKPVQALSGPDEGPIRITKIECVIVDPNLPS